MKKILALLCSLFILAATAGPSPTTLLNAVTTTGAGSTFVLKGDASGSQRVAGDNPTNLRTFQFYGTTSAGSGAAVCDVEASNDGTNWVVLGTISLTLGTTATNGGFVSQAPWNYIRGNVKSISGTTATVTLTIGA